MNRAPPGLVGGHQASELSCNWTPWDPHFLTPGRNHSPGPEDTASERAQALPPGSRHPAQGADGEPRSSGMWSASVGGCLPLPFQARERKRSLRFPSRRHFENFPVGKGEKKKAKEFKVSGKPWAGCGRGVGRGSGTCQPLTGLAGALSRPPGRAERSTV